MSATFEKKEEERILQIDPDIDANKHDLADLSNLRFRFPTTRDALPTSYLHVSCTTTSGTNHAKSTIDSNVTPLLFSSPTLMLSLFSRHGIITGISIPPHRRFLYLQFQHATQAAHALNALHHYYCSEMNGTLQVHFACIRRTVNTSSSNSSSFDSSSIPSTNVSYLSSLRLYPSVITPHQEATIFNVHSVNLKGDVHFGTALPEEDGRFGLPKPKPIPERLSFLPQLTNEKISDKKSEGNSDLNSSIGSNDSNKNHEQPAKVKPLPPSFYTPFSSPLPSDFGSPFTRFTLFSMHPGAGIKRQLHPLNVYTPPLAFLPIGGHTIVDLYRRNSDTIDASILVPSGSLLCLPQEVTSSYEYGIAYRTRDEIGKEKLKRTKIILIIMRTPLASNSNPTQPAAPIPSRPISSTSSIPLPPSALLSPEELESKHVTSVYNSIASHFSNTRHSPWPRIESYVKSLPAGSVVLDAGCGNGKYMGLNRRVTMVGCDISAKLVEICKSKGYNAIVADCLSLPFPSDTYSHTICIAVLHHLSTPERRLTCLRELTRVTKLGGRILVSAWAMEQDRGSRRRFETADVLVPWRLPKRFIQSQQSQGKEQEEEKSTDMKEEEIALTEGEDGLDCEEGISDERGDGIELSGGRNADDLIYDRYCHVYVEGELERLLDEVVGIRIVSSYYDRGNWCLLFEKT